MRDRRGVLNTTTVSPLQLSANQTRLFVSQGRVGYGIQQYLSPAGVRQWPAPSSLGAESRSADVDPRDRWLLTACAGG